MLIAALFALTACGASGKSSERREARQEPDSYAPGVRISGEVRVGVAGTF